MVDVIGAEHYQCSKPADQSVVLREIFDGHTPTKARTLLPGQLHPKGKEQQQIRKGEGFADGAQAAQELRTHETANGALDRAGNGIVNRAAHQRNQLNGSENLALSS